ncbi:hypothetical protein Psyaliredsea_13080 [Psychrobacter alimentarius]
MTHIDKIQVTKRDGRLEPINLDKIHKVIAWAADGLENVSVSQVELKSHIQFYEGIKTRDIHETIIKSAADLISETTPDYQYLAARLAIFHLRKIAYNRFTPPHLYDHVKTLTDAGKYDQHILADYSRAEFDELEEYLDHWRDMNLAYAAVEQMAGNILYKIASPRRFLKARSSCTCSSACVCLLVMTNQTAYTTSNASMMRRQNLKSHYQRQSCQVCVRHRVSLARAS